MHGPYAGALRRRGGLIAASTGAAGIRTEHPVGAVWVSANQPAAAAGTRPLPP